MLTYLSDLRALQDAVPSELIIASGSLLLVGGLLLWFTASNTKKIPTNAKNEPLPRPSTTLPLLKNSLDFVKHANRFHDWVLDQFQEFDGKPWVLSAPGRPDTIMLNSPELLEEVEKTHFEIFGKGTYQREYLFDWLGQVMATEDGDRWRLQRKTTANLFSHRALQSYMSESILKNIVTLEKVLTDAMAYRETIDMCRVFNQFTMEVFAEIGYGMNLGSLGAPEPHPFEVAFDEVPRAVYNRFLCPTWLWKTMRWLNIGSEATLKRSMKLVHQTAMEVIATTVERRAQNGGKAQGKDIVSLFLDSEHTKEFLNPTLLRDVVAGLIVAGRDSTAQTMTWFTYCLSQHPEVEMKIRREIAEVLPEVAMGKPVEFSMDQLQKLHYLEAALKETLRLYPVVAFNMRQAFEDVVLSDGTFFPKGTFAGICLYSMARTPSVWGPDCNEYKPERWLDPDTGKLLNTISQYKFNSFHGGPRICLGMNMALMEMKTVLVRVLSKFHLALVPGQTVTYDQAITLPVKGALMVRIEPATPLSA